MSTKHEGWGWMLAVDFFFAGMGGGPNSTNFV